MKKTTFLKLSLFVIFSAFVYWFLFFEPTIEYGFGIKAPDLPIQKNIKNGKTFSLKEYQITPLAEYDITAKILSIESYSSDRESELSPIDFALGWGRMSDEAVLEKLSIRQSRRWYYWRTKQFPIPKKEIEQSSCNVHIIPANEDIEDQLDDIIKGQIVNLKGFLVYVEGEGNYKWRSSLSREDKGNHACEVFYVNEIVLPFIYGTESEF